MLDGDPLLNHRPQRLQYGAVAVARTGLCGDQEQAEYLFHRGHYCTTVIEADPTSALRLAVTTTDPVATADTKPAEETVATAVFTLVQVTAESPDWADATRDSV